MTDQDIKLNEMIAAKVEERRQEGLLAMDKKYTSMVLGQNGQKKNKKR